jgi:AraC-like DNA-binding protein
MLVAGPDTTRPALSTATRILELVASQTCLEVLNSVLSKEVDSLNRRVASLLKTKWKDGSVDGGRVPPLSPPVVRKVRDEQVPLVERAIACLQSRYLEHGLSMKDIALELRCNSRYLSTRFTEIEEIQMHVFLLRLRVHHACRLLLETDALVKEIAHASGFCEQGRLARAFRSQIGISPTEYRRMFAGPAART